MFPFFQHVAQSHPGRTDAAEGRAGDSEEGQLAAGPGAEPPAAELRGAAAAAHSGPEGVGGPAAAAAAGTPPRHTQKSHTSVS